MHIVNLDLNAVLRLIPSLADFGLRKVDVVNGELHTVSDYNIIIDGFEDVIMQAVREGYFGGEAKTKSIATSSIIMQIDMHKTILYSYEKYKESNTFCEFDRVFYSCMSEHEKALKFWENLLGERNEN